MAFEAILTIDGKHFQVVEFKFNFYRHRDFTGKPTSFPEASVVQVKLKIMGDETFITWMANPNQKKNVDIKFLKGENESSLMSLSLIDSYCVTYEDKFRTGTDESTFILIEIASGKFEFSQGSKFMSWDNK